MPGGGPAQYPAQAAGYSVVPVPDGGPAQYPAQAAGYWDDSLDLHSPWHCGATVVLGTTGAGATVVLGSTGAGATVVLGIAGAGATVVGAGDVSPSQEHMIAGQ